MRSQSSLALAPKAVQIGKTADLVRLVRIVRTFLHAKLTWRRHTRLRVSGGTRLLHHGTMARCAKLIPRKGTALGAHVLVAKEEMRSPRRESSLISHISPKNERDTPNFLQVEETRSACAPCIKERRMEIREPRNLTGNRG